MRNRNKRVQNGSERRDYRKDRLDKQSSSRFNDVSWYSRNDKILKDAASLSFNNPLGAKTTIVQAAQKQSETLYSVAGICAIGFHALPGISTDNSSAVNLAARDIYAFVRHQNSGSANYDSPDLMMYLLAMDYAYLWFNYCKRAYGTMMQYSQLSRYMPKGLVTAQGFNFDSLQADLADFRYGLNVVAAKLNALYVPNVMTMFIRHSWMVSNMWADSASAKAQVYLYRPYCYMTLSEQNDTPGLQIKHTINPMNLTVSQALSILDNMVSAIVQSEDMNIMAGDLRKAYGAEKAFMLSGVDADYSVRPVYNEEVLQQLHNLTTVGDVANPGLDITIDNNTNALLCNPSVTNQFLLNERSPMLNMRKDDPTPADVMVSSRLTAYAAGSAIYTCGTEVVTQWTIFYNYADTNNPWGPVETVNKGNLYNLTPTAAGVNGLQYLLPITQFDWHPLIWMKSAPTTGTAMYLGVIGDLNNYTVFDAYTLSKMHETAILSELGVPINGTI